MKRLIIILVIALLGLVSYPQNGKRNQIDISGSIFFNSVFHFSESNGEESVENGEGYRFGLQYSRLITNKIWINVGVSNLRMSNIYHGVITVIQWQDSKIIQIPVRIRYDLIKWLYVKSGFSFDIQTNNKEGLHVDNQSGIGFSLIGGLDLKLSESIRFSVEPELGITSLIPFSGNNNQQHFFLTGVNLNVGYKF
ncbi:hypothetical protein ES705_36380 [subsurface metagenome]